MIALRGAVDRCIEVAIGGETLSLRHAELDRLVSALAELDLPGAASVADDIAALRLAGGRIHLYPTEAELAAVRAALSGVASERQPLGPSPVGLFVSGHELGGTE